MTAAGGALTLLTLLGGNAWLRAWFLQGGSGTVLTLGTMTVPTSDGSVLILGITATLGVHLQSCTEDDIRLSF